MEKATMPRPPAIRDTGDGERFELLEDFTYVTKAGKRITVPSGYVTDMASVPRLFWRVYPKSGPYNRAAIVHDWLYNTHMVSRAEADKIFLEGMEACGVPAWKRYPMYWAVRAGGGFCWGLLALLFALLLPACRNVYINSQIIEASGVYQAEIAASIYSSGDPRANQTKEVPIEVGRGSNMTAVP